MRIRSPRRAPPDRRRVARSLGWFYVSAPLMAEVWAAMQSPRPGGLVPMVAICVMAQALGALLLRGAADDAPAHILKALLSFASVLVAGLCLASGADGSGFAYLFLWATPYAFFFGLRHAAVQSAFAAALIVAPVVITSSTSRTVPPSISAPESTRNASLTFSLRSLRPSPV